MKISFDDGGYLEVQRSRKPHHVYVLVASRKSPGSMELIVNSAEVSLSQLLEIVQSVTGPVMLDSQEEQQEEQQEEE